MMHQNPFQYGKIAEREHFIDRDEDRRFLKQTLLASTNVIIISPRRWGKSSVVKQAMRELCEEQSHVKACFIDAFPITSSKEFYEIFAREVLRATASRLELVMDMAKRFLQSLSPKFAFSPDRLSEFSISLSMNGNAQEEREVLSLPEKIAEEKGIRIVVCIDEFQKLAKLHDYERLESMMRSVWQHHQHTSYCFYGSQRHMMSEIFNSSEKPFYRFGQLYYLKKIRREDWMEYIINRFTSTGKVISQSLAQRIVNTVECHSWYVQQLASAVWNFTDHTADDATFDKAFTWCKDVNAETYHNTCDALGDAQIGLLRAVAAGESTLSSAATLRRYRLGTSANVTKNKRTLINNDIIQLSEGVLTFVDPLFCHWFIERYR